MNETKFASRLTQRTTEQRAVRRKAHGRSLTSVAVISLLCGCAAEEGASSEGDPQELASVASDGETQEDDVADQETLAELTVSGAHVQFLKAADGTLLVVARSESADNILNGPETENLSTVQLYEHLAHKPAPEALVAVAGEEPRHSRGRRAGAIDQDAGSVVTASWETGVTRDKHTNDEFVEEYCVNSPLRCWTDVYTEDTNFRIRANLMTGAINLINGDGVLLRLRTRGSNIAQWQIAPGEHVTWRASPGTVYPRIMEAFVEHRKIDISAATDDWPHGYERSDRYHLMIDAEL